MKQNDVRYNRAIIVAVNFAFAESQSCGNVPYQMADIEAAQLSLVSLPLSFWTVAVIHGKSQKVGAELVHVLLIDKRRHDVADVFLNGFQFPLLAFCLTLIEVINTLLIGRAGWGDRNSGWLIAGIGFFYDLSICNCYILGNLLDHLGIANVLSHI